MSRPTAQDYALVDAHLDPNRSLAAHTAWDVRDCGAKAVMALRASLAAAEAKLADERKHADELAKAVGVARWDVRHPIGAMLAAHAARRAARDGYQEVKR